MFKSWMWKQRSYREQFEAGETGSAGGSTDVVADDAADAGDADAQEDDDADQDADDRGDAADPADDDGEVVVLLGDEQPPAATDDEIEGKPAPQWVRDLRKSDREKAKRIRELEQQVAAGKQPQQQPAQIVVGDKPTLEGCDFDAESYADKLVAWNDRKRQADEQVAQARQEQETAQAAWQQKLNGYSAAKTALKVPDFDDAEAVVLEKLSKTQQAILISGAKSHAALIYALGKNPAQLQKLAAIKDPVEYAFAAARLEGELKVVPRKNPPAPERQVRSSAGSSSIDSTEARLEKEADASGDRSNLIAYRRQKRRQQAA